MTHKDFDLDDAPSEDLHELGPTFTLGGQDFRCVPIVPAGMVGPIMLTFVRSRNAEGVEVQTRDIERCLEVIEGLLVERIWIEGDHATPELTPSGWQAVDDIERWQRLMKSRVTLIDSPKVARVFDWILGEYSRMNARPT